MKEIIRLPGDRDKETAGNKFLINKARKAEKMKAN
jgi:hypothetical protein